MPPPQTGQAVNNPLPPPLVPPTVGVAAPPPNAESSGDGRSALLQAIQKGKALRKAEQRPVLETTGTSPGIASVLKEKMRLRRNDIAPDSPGWS